MLPAHPQRLTVRIDDSGESLRLVHNSRRWSAVVFLTQWLIGWTVGCVFLTGLVIREPKLFNFLFAVPFWASWLFVFARLIQILFQREEFAIGPQGVTFFRRVFALIKRREISLPEIKDIATYQRIVDSESGQCESGLELRTLGQPLRFAEGLSEPELAWLQYMLRERLARLRQTYHVAEPAAESDIVHPTAERLSISDGSPIQPPSDCGWHRTDDFDAVVFSHRGRLSLSNIALLLFITVFWNGIVSVFVCELLGLGDQPQGAEWWGLFFFLIPFEAIGLAIFAGLIIALVEPVRRMTWRVGRSDVMCHLSWLGFGPTWTYLIEGLDRLDLSSTEGKDDRENPRQILSWKPRGATFRLSLIDKSNCEVCTIDALTEGEACWMTDVIRRERSSWFR